jgi:hypothetical protein
MGVTKPSKVKMCTGKIQCDGGDESIEVDVRLAYGPDADGISLTSGEAHLVLVRALRKISAILEELPFTDFGVENTRVTF